MKHSEPLIWMNVTTSATWTRPAVGIVRVEQALCSELSKIFGPRFRQCVWLDGEFVEHHPALNSPDAQTAAAVDQLLPPIPTFAAARQYLAGRLARFRAKVETTKRNLERATFHARIPVDRHPRAKPMAGDILISVGLDWDQPYAAQFYKYSKYHGLKIITCCHDLIPVIFPQYCVGEVAARFKSYFNSLSWGSATILCVSQQSKNDLIEMLRQISAPLRDTRVITLGDTIPAGTTDISDEIRRITSEPFILFVSTIERRKNHEVLYRAYHILSRAGHAKKLPKLIFVGMPGWGVNDLLSDLDLDPYTKGLIIQLHHVSDGELRLLYEKAEFCLYPSFYEGWGLPVAEALALGKPVLSSDQGSLPEVGGDLVRYVSPWSPLAWAEAILHWVEHPDELAAAGDRVKNEYVRRRWSDTGRIVADVISEVIAKPQIEWVFYPGYDFSTTCGLKVGPKLRSTGASGRLMYGPYIGLTPGQYRVEVKGKVHMDSRQGMLTFDVAAEKADVILTQQVFDSMTAIGKGPPADFSVFMEFNLKNHVDDLEVRCEIDHGTRCDINLVQISKIS